MTEIDADLNAALAAARTVYFGHVADGNLHASVRMNGHTVPELDIEDAVYSIAAKRRGSDLRRAWNRLAQAEVPALLGVARKSSPSCARSKQVMDPQRDPPILGRSSSRRSGQSRSRYFCELGLRRAEDFQQRATLVRRQMREALALIASIGILRQPRARHSRGRRDGWYAEALRVDEIAQRTLQQASADRARAANDPPGRVGRATRTTCRILASCCGTLAGERCRVDEQQSPRTSGSNIASSVLATGPAIPPTLDVAEVDAVLLEQRVRLVAGTSDQVAHVRLMFEDARARMSLVSVARRSSRTALYALCIAPGEAKPMRHVRVSLDQDVAQMLLFRRLPRHEPARPSDRGSACGRSCRCRAGRVSDSPALSTSVERNRKRGTPPPASAPRVVTGRAA